MEFIEGLRDRLRKRGDGWEKGVRSVTKSLANDSWREICLKKKKRKEKEKIVIRKYSLTNWNFLKKCRMQRGREERMCFFCFDIFILKRE